MGGRREGGREGGRGEMDDYAHEFVVQEEEGLVGREGGRERGREGGRREVGEDGGEGGKGGREGRDAYLDEVGVLVRVLLAFLLRL